MNCPVICVWNEAEWMMMMMEIEWLCEYELDIGHGQQKNIDEYGLSGHCLLQYIAYRVPM